MCGASVARRVRFLDDSDGKVVGSWEIAMSSNPVYLEIVDFFASGTTPQAIIDFKPSPAAQRRAQELLELAKEGQLNPEQESELEHFTELEHILRMAKARARQILAARQ
jgi:hypothetical protein